MTNDNHLKTAYAYLYIRDFAAARRAFDEAIRKDPDNPETYFHASVTALRNGELEFAHKTAEAAIALCPNDAFYVSHLHAVRAEMMIPKARQAFLSGNHAEGARLLNEAVETDPLCDAAYELQREYERGMFLQ